MINSSIHILIRGISMTAVILFFYGCKCSDVTCPGFDTKYSDWLPYANGDTIKFMNDSGNQINFIVSKVDISTLKTLPCGPDGLGGCHCPECPSPSAEIYAQTNDTSRKIVNALGYTVEYFKYLNIGISNQYTLKDSIKLSYSIFDCSNRINIEPALRINPGDSLFSTISLGNITYNDVVMHQVDTTVIHSPNPIYNVYFVWKSYYNKQFGVIAFYDLKTNSFFYRKP